MQKTQGEFATRAQAQRAVEALMGAGVARGHLRVWNIIPERRPARPARPGYSATRTYAFTGAVVGGLAGFAVGATLGSVRDAARSGGPHLPLPSGVRVVVDELPSGTDAAAILRENGASNVR